VELLILIILIVFSLFLSNFNEDLNKYKNIFSLGNILTLDGVLLSLYAIFKIDSLKQNQLLEISLQKIEKLQKEINKKDTWFIDYIDNLIDFLKDHKIIKLRTIKYFNKNSAISLNTLEKLLDKQKRNTKEGLKEQINTEVNTMINYLKRERGK